MRRFLAVLFAALTICSLAGCAKVECPTEPDASSQPEESAVPSTPELSPEEQWEQEHWEMLCRIAPAQFTVRHYAALAELEKK